MLTNIHLVAPIARNIQRRVPPSIELDDLISMGHIGLIHAAEKYDARRKVPFEFFARYKIKRAILDGLGQRTWQDAKGQRHLRRLWRDENHGRLTPALTRTLAAAAAPLDSAIAQEQDRRDLSRAASALPPEERKVIDILYGRQRRLSDAAKALDVSVYEACRTHRRALKNMKRELGMRGRKAA